MPTPTYTPLANLTLTSGQSSVTFSSISQSYKDLILVVSVLATSNTVNLTMRMNGDTANYSSVTIYGDGSSTGTFTSTSNLDISAGDGTTTTFGNSLVSIFDYSATDKHKSYVSNGYNASYSVANAGRWASTSAVTSLTIRTTTAYAYAAGSTFTLYGVIG